MNSFNYLGLELRLDFTTGELKKRYQELSKSNHPDVGGSPNEFSKIQSAYEDLNSPSRRLKAALATLNNAAVCRGAVPPQVLDLFSPIASALEQVDRSLHERSMARSNLSRALIDAKIPELKISLDSLQEKIGKLEMTFTDKFGLFDSAGWQESQNEMDETSRGLAFLEKWQTQIRAAIGKLLEALLEESS